MESALIYHITTQTDWQTAQTAGVYTADSLATEGFIHCSRWDQVLMVANAFYQEVADCVLLEIDTARLPAPVRWEAPSHPDGRVDDPGSGAAQDRFPHIYGTIPIRAVRRVLDLAKDDDGAYKLPES